MKQQEQLLLFPFYSVVHDVSGFLLNLCILTLDERIKESVFFVKPRNADERKTLSRFFCENRFTYNFSGVSRVSKEKQQEEKDANDDFGFCQTCGKPAIYRLECSCGTHAWCQEHENVSIWTSHNDHDCCDSECCKRGHILAGINRSSIFELEAVIPRTDTSVEEIVFAGGAFKVKFKRKTAEERLGKLVLLIDGLQIDEAEGMEEKRDGGSSVFGLGQNVWITPEYSFSSSLYTAILLLGEPLAGQVVFKEVWGKITEYTILLPKGMILPNSRQFNLGGQHCLTLSREELSAMK